MVNGLEKAKSRDKVVESVRDLYTAKITLPLGNPNLKLLHTNQMLFTQLTEQEFELANFAEITKHLNSTYNRFGGYVLNRWYVESVTINNKGSSGTIDIEINPFPTTLMKFRDDRNKFFKEYTDAVSSANNSNNSNSIESCKQS